MANLEEKRIKLFNDFKSNAEKENLLAEFNKKYPSFSSWETINFKDETSVLSIWDKAIRDIIAPTSREKFFQTFACDLDWAKTTKYCGAEPKKETEKTQGQQDKPVEKNVSIKQKQQNLFDKGYFIGTTGPNKNGVDGVEGNKTKYAQHALDSGIDSSTYNNIYKQKNPELTQTIEGLFGKQEPKQIQTGGQTQGSQTQTGGQTQGSQTQTARPTQGSQTQTGGQTQGNVTQPISGPQKARVIKTINPKNW